MVHTPTDHPTTRPARRPAAPAGFRSAARPAALVALVLLLLAGCGSGPRDGGDGGDGKSRTGKATASPADRWRPRPGTSWQWQLSGRLDTSVDAAVYDIDGFDHSKETVAALHRAGRKVICYVSTGAWEDFRPDAGRFPAPVLGEGNGWKGERWFDIRRTDVLRPLLAARLDMCRDKGFDAVEPDNMDGYRNRTGFPLTAADQLRYNRLVASLAHARGMSVGLKNDLDQIPELVGDFDFAVNEQCAQYGECARLKPFVAAGKAVFHTEYELPTGRFCARSRELELSSLLKKYELGAWRRAC
ncbi:endo alpha-1,4 polygalactosaminidase [Streptomyces sp. PsTaAH-124]|uniref:endo alpha-1,4 polygalactosaminidase n=1 Tax=Streptomyces sp. PsTaAH-124 TaxID=1157638 RepID=UPI000365073B|nr:endo alpha-1,4 polygalactosaminidase [Streptomyces sp. PsTaAH-124]